MPDTYGEMFSDLVDALARYEDRSEIFRRNEIPRNQFYNVTNPNRETSSGRPFHSPIEWLVRLTRDSQNFSMLKRVVRDCGCICITPDEIAELKSVESGDQEKVLTAINKMLGLMQKSR